MEKTTMLARLHYPTPDQLKFSSSVVAEYCKVVLESPGLERLDFEQVRRIIIEHVRIALVTSELNGNYCLNDRNILFVISNGILHTIKRVKQPRVAHVRQQAK